MQAHWMEVGPPTYISSAGLAGWKPQNVEEVDYVAPEDLGVVLGGIPGGRVG